MNRLEKNTEALRVRTIKPLIDVDVFIRKEIFELLIERDKILEEEKEEVNTQSPRETEKYHCSRCGEWVEKKDITVYHFKSVIKEHVLLSIQLCLTCRTEPAKYVPDVENS